MNLGGVVVKKLFKIVAVLSLILTFAYNLFGEVYQYPINLGTKNGLN